MHHKANNPLQHNHQLASALLKLDNYTFNHSYRVHKLALLIGKELELSDQELELLELGALFHDIGKLKISRTILNKPSGLTEDEWKIMRTHPQAGYQIVKNAGLCETVQHIVLFHHRWYNGKGGYPDSPIKHSPCMLTQIVTVSDVVDAMTSKRPYRDALTIDSCIQYLQENSNLIFHRRILSKVIELQRNNILHQVMQIS